MNGILGIDVRKYQIFRELVHLSFKSFLIYFLINILQGAFDFLERCCRFIPAYPLKGLQNSFFPFLDCFFSHFFLLCFSNNQKILMERMDSILSFKALSTKIKILALRAMITYINWSILTTIAYIIFKDIRQLFSNSTIFRGRYFQSMD